MALKLSNILALSIIFLSVSGQTTYIQRELMVLQFENSTSSDTDVTNSSNSDSRIGTIIDKIAQHSANSTNDTANISSNTTQVDNSTIVDSSNSTDIDVSNSTETGVSNSTTTDASNSTENDASNFTTTDASNSTSTEASNSTQASTSNSTITDDSNSTTSNDVDITVDTVDTNSGTETYITVNQDSINEYIEELSEDKQQQQEQAYDDAVTQAEQQEATQESELTKLIKDTNVSAFWQLVIAGVIMLPIAWCVLKFIFHSFGFCRRGMSCCGSGDEVEDNELLIEDDKFDDFEKLKDTTV